MMGRSPHKVREAFWFLIAKAQRGKKGMRAHGDMKAARLSNTVITLQRTS